MAGGLPSWHERVITSIGNLKLVFIGSICSIPRHMSKIINTNQAIEISRKLKNEGKTIVLAGGIFDILHLGHVEFLQAAKKRGDFLFVLLESDKAAKKFKGKDRPFNNQKERADILSALKAVDYVVMLSGVLKNKDYDKIVGLISPVILAITQNDPNKKHKDRQGKLFGIKVVSVIKRVKGKSTTEILRYF